MSGGREGSTMGRGEIRSSLLAFRFSQKPRPSSLVPSLLALGYSLIVISRAVACNTGKQREPPFLRTANSGQLKALYRDLHIGIGVTPQERQAREPILGVDGATDVWRLFAGQ